MMIIIYASSVSPTVPNATLKMFSVKTERDVDDYDDDDDQQSS